MERKGIVYVLAAAALWGLSGVFAQFLFHHRGINPENLVSLRLLLPGIVLLLISWAKEKGRMFQVWRTEPIRMLIYAVFGMAAVQMTFFITIKHSNAATATVLQFMNPVIIAIAVSIGLRRLPQVALYPAMLLALGGTFLIATHGKIGSLSISKEALAWGLTSAVASAFYTLYSIGLIRRNGGAVVGWAMFAGGVVMSIFFHPWQLGGVWDGYTWLSILYVLILGSLVTFYLYLMGVQIIGGAKASILGCTEPLAAAAFSILFLKIHFTGMDWLGTLCITGAVFLLARMK